MIDEVDRNLVERFKRLTIERGIPLYKTIVFGSRARGERDPESDLDILVLVESLDFAIRRTISRCAWEVGFEAGIIIQTVVMTRDQAEKGPEQSSLLMLAVREEGVPV
jgi:predicted nucleotidyltransferase